MYFISILSLCFVGIFLILAQADDDIDAISVTNILITNGTMAKQYSAPYMAFLIIKTTTGKQSLCGGVLVSPHYVLTAAHCVNNATSIKVILGLHEITSVGDYQIRVRAKSWMVHKNSKLHDLAAIQLASTVSFTKGSDKAHLPPREDADKNYVGQTARVYGWGITERKEISRVLMYAEMPIVENTVCEQPDNFICAAKINKTGICSGDSGGPLVIGRRVVGLVHGSKCGKGDLVYPSVFIKLNHYLEWINENTDVILE